MVRRQKIWICDLCGEEREFRFIYHNCLSVEYKAKRRPFGSERWEKVDICGNCLKKIIDIKGERSVLREG